jgi:lipid II:glycine glycyltransferase (peptidoglycan interpeptide bridge formation enzyme)
MLHPADNPDRKCRVLRHYDIRVSDDVEDPDWDSFLAETCSGQHVQTSAWAQVKAWLGWKAARIVISERKRIVAGAQMLIRTDRFLGTVAYLPKGPVLLPDDRGLADLFMSKLHELGEDQGVRVMFVQPPDNGSRLADLLPQWGFQRSPVQIAPTATTLLDLSPDLDTILARMRKGMRNGIRRSQRRGITVREGTEHDLPTFYQLLTATSRRRGFTPFPEEYFSQMWRVLEPRGQVKVVFGEYAGEPVCAQLVIPFGETVVAKQIGWSGSHGNQHPNEALDWATIQWARSNGYQYYDLEGIEREAAKAILAGQPLPQSLIETPTAYKVRLGGQVRLSPEAFCYISNPVFRMVYNRGGYRLAKSQVVKNLVNRFRTCGTAASGAGKTTK